MPDISFNNGLGIGESLSFSSGLKDVVNQSSGVSIENSLKSSSLEAAVTSRMVGSVAETLYDRIGSDRRAAEAEDLANRAGMHVDALGYDLAGESNGLGSSSSFGGRSSVFGEQTSSLGYDFDKYGSPVYESLTVEEKQRLLTNLDSKQEFLRGHGSKITERASLGSQAKVKFTDVGMSTIDGVFNEGAGGGDDSVFSDAVSGGRRARKFLEARKLKSARKAVSVLDGAAKSSNVAAAGLDTANTTTQAISVLDKSSSANKAVEIAKATKTSMPTLAEGIRRSHQLALAKGSAGGAAGAAGLLGSTGGAAAAGGASAGAAAAGSAAVASGPVGWAIIAAVIFLCLLMLSFGSCSAFSAVQAEASMIEGNSFGKMYYWIEYETGATDDSAFDNVTLFDGTIRSDGRRGQAYGVQFDLHQGSLRGFVKFCYESDPEAYSMFEPYVGLSLSRFISTCYATSESDPFPSAWHAAFAANRDDFIAKQKEYVYQNFYLPVEKYLEKAGYRISDRDDTCKGALLSWAHQHGPYNIIPSQYGGTNHFANSGITNDDSDAEFIEKLYNQRTEIYGNWGGLNLANRYKNEKNTALNLLLRAEFVYGEDYQNASDAQRRVVQACNSTSWPGESLCAAWVSNVYANAGFVAPSGNGNTILNGAETFSGSSPIEVGMAISAQYGSNTPAGNKYGHVGIYVGDGKVMHSVTNGVEIMDLSDWINTYGRGWVKWGYPSTVKIQSI